MANLFEQLPRPLSEELCETLVQGGRVRIERIISTGQTSPDGFWYDQAEWEWVAVLQGEAKLLFEHDAEPVHMRSGDHLTISPHRRHRVVWTAPDEPTVWLAVFYCDAETNTERTPSRPGDSPR